MIFQTIWMPKVILAKYFSEKAGPYNHSKYDLTFLLYLLVLTTKKNWKFFCLQPTAITENAEFLKIYLRLPKATFYLPKVAKSYLKLPKVAYFFPWTINGQQSTILWSISKGFSILKYINKPDLSHWDIQYN